MFHRERGNRVPQRDIDTARAARASVGELERRLYIGRVLAVAPPAAWAAELRKYALSDDEGREAVRLYRADCEGLFATSQPMTLEEARWMIQPRPLPETG